MSERDDLQAIERENLKAFANAEAAKLRVLAQIMSHLSHIKSSIHLIAVVVSTIAFIAVALAVCWEISK